MLYNDSFPNNGIIFFPTFGMYHFGNKQNQFISSSALVCEHVLVYRQGCMLQSDLAIRCASLCGLVLAFLNISSEHLNDTGTPVITWKYFLDSDHEKH